jgi:hypothetical protein
MAEVVSRMMRASSSSGFWVDAAACASLTRKLSSRAARLLSDSSSPSRAPDITRIRLNLRLLK